VKIRRGRWAYLSPVSGRAGRSNRTRPASGRTFVGQYGYRADGPGKCQGHPCRDSCSREDTRGEKDHTEAAAGTDFVAGRRRLPSRDRTGKTRRDSRGSYDGCDSVCRSWICQEMQRAGSRDFPRRRLQVHQSLRALCRRSGQALKPGGVFKTSKGCGGFCPGLSVGIGWPGPAR